MRVAPPRIDGAVSGAPRPAAGAPGADAHRQTGFVLGGEVNHVLRGLELEAESAKASSGAKFRKQPTAAALLAWSRSWLARVDALHATQVGNYAAAVPVVRAAADYTATTIAMIESDAREWEEWLDDGGVGLAADAHATEYRLHAFRSAETLAAHPDLGAVYRESSDLAMPHFGATLLLAGHESGPDRIAPTFGDRDFHLGLAEIVLGWLLRLGAVHLGAVDAHPQWLAAANDHGPWLSFAGQLTSRSDCCRLEAVERNGERRTMVREWRKRSGDAPRRILL